MGPDGLVRGGRLRLVGLLAEHMPRSRGSPQAYRH